MDAPPCIGRKTPGFQSPDPSKTFVVGGELKTGWTGIRLQIDVPEMLVVPDLRPLFDCAVSEIAISDFAIFPLL